MNPSIYSVNAASMVSEVESLFPVVNHKGVAFRVVGPFFQSVSRMKWYRQLAEKVVAVAPRIDVLLALDSRGYLIAESIAHVLADQWNADPPHVVMAAKPGKLAGDVVSVSGHKEYGTTSFEMMRHAIAPGQCVVVVDDVVATGGSCMVAKKLIEQAGGICSGVVCLVELNDLGAAALLGQTPIVSLVQFKGLRSEAELCQEQQPPLSVEVEGGRECVQTQLDTAELPSSSSSSSSPPVILVPHASMLSSAEKLVAYAPRMFRICRVAWNKFPDGSHNTTFEDMDTLQSFHKHLVFLGSFYDFQKITEQLSMCTAMCGQASKSYTVSFNYLPFTHERVTRDESSLDAAGMTQFGRQAVATAHTLSKQLCGAVSGRPVFRFFDIHVEAARFYTNDKDMIPLELSMLPSMLSLFDREYTLQDDASEANLIVTPDAGAMKRYLRYLGERAVATCDKKRGHDEERVITLKDVCNLDKNKVVKNILLIDDMVGSGSTLRECALVLRSLYPQVRHVMAFVTHAKFPGDLYKRFCPGGEWAGTFDKIYVSDSIPEVADKLRTLSPYHVIDTAPILAHQYARQFDLTHLLIPEFHSLIRVAVASTNPDKVNAVRFAFQAHYPYARILCTSVPTNNQSVHAQPVGRAETERGVIERTKSFNDYHYIDFHVAIESGAFLKTLSTTEYVDQAFVCVSRVDKNTQHIRKASCYSRPTPFPPGVMELSRETQYAQTAGSFIAAAAAATTTSTTTNTTSSDWHIEWGGSSRVDLIKQAVEMCLYRI